MVFPPGKSGEKVGNLEPRDPKMVVGFEQFVCCDCLFHNTVPFMLLGFCLADNSLGTVLLYTWEEGQRLTSNREVLQPSDNNKYNTV